MAIDCNVTQEPSVVSAFALVVAHFGRLDGLVNNAGIVLEKTLAETSMEDFDRVIAVNLRGTFLCGKIARNYFEPQPDNPPRIVNIASEIGHSGLANYSAYTASKGGIYSLTRSWALELAPQQSLIKTLWTISPNHTNDGKWHVKQTQSVQDLRFDLQKQCPFAARSSHWLCRSGGHPRGLSCPAAAPP